MKILVITDLYPITLEEKTTPRTIYDFVKSWENFGHTVKVIKPNFLLNSFLRKKPFYKSGIYGQVENINYFFPFLGNVQTKIKTNFQPDIVIAHMPSGIIFANKLAFPFIAGVHCSDIEVLTNPIYSIYFKNELEQAYKNAKKIACRSDILKQKFLNLYPQYEDKTFAAYSGIDKQIITTRNWENKRRILTCAQLIKRKNIDKVISACASLNLELTVIGEGKERNYLEKLSNKVKFLGHVSHAKVLEVMRHSDIFILPSINETFGMVYLEAMASGCVTVGLKNDGIDGIIVSGQNGYLTDLDSIKETLCQILENNQNFILQNSHQTIQNFTKEYVAQNYLKEMQSLF